MTSINHEEVRKAWLRHFRPEMELWLGHIVKKKENIMQTEISIFERAELLYNIFAYINLLAQVDLRTKDPIYIKDIISWLHQTIEWPEDILEAFWYCVRNPIMHMGRSDIFSNYNIKNKGQYLYGDFILNLDLDIEENSWVEMPTIDGKGKVVSFCFPGVYRQLESILDLIMQNITNADNKSLEKLSKVNQIIPFRILSTD